MFRTLLLPVDGSELSMKAAYHGIDLAKAVGGSVVAFFARVPPDSIYTVEYVPMDPLMLEKHDKHQLDTAEHIFAKLRLKAQASGVSISTASEVSNDIASMISKVAKEHKCDLIVIGSHGRGALGRMFMGGVAVRLLSNTTLPVLVYRTANKSE